MKSLAYPILYIFWITIGLIALVSGKGSTGQNVGISLALLAFGTALLHWIRNYHKDLKQKPKP